MDHQEKLKILKSVQELMIREFGRRIERADLLSLTTMTRIAVDFLDFLTNTEAVTSPADQSVAEMHAAIRAGLDSLYALRRIDHAFPRKAGAREYVWPTCTEFREFKETYRTIFEKMTDINIGAESRLACLMELARQELLFLGKTF